VRAKGGAGESPRGTMKGEGLKNYLSPPRGSTDHTDHRCNSQYRIAVLEYAIGKVIAPNIENNFANIVNITEQLPH
jgi:hypothetical protein